MIESLFQLSYAFQFLIMLWRISPSDVFMLWNISMIPLDYSKDTNFEVFCDKKVFNILDIFIIRIFVIYWPSTEPSINRCTCVNKRKNSGSKWTLNNNVTGCTGGSSQLVTRCRSESQRKTVVFGPSVTYYWATLAKKELLLWLEELGSI